MLKSKQVDRMTQAIHAMVRSLFEETPFSTLLENPATLLANPGKMLRARLLIRVGPVHGVPEELIVRGGAAIELAHTATLLHDDVIDNAHLRRNQPAFWRQHGTSAAILLGDLLLFYALKLLLPLKRHDLSEALIQFAGEVGEAEVMQEIISRGTPRTWEACMQTARHKTGPFFAFMAMMAGGDHEVLARELTECGYLIGTAYQLADDLHDAQGQREQADKSLHRDSSRGKHTIADLSALSPVRPEQAIYGLLEAAQERLAPYPDTHHVWMQYITNDFEPALATLI